MKAILLAGLAMAVHAPSVLAQGLIYLSDESLANSLVVTAPSNWYSGTFGMEVWMLNSRIVPVGINLSPAPGAGILGYNAMAAAGFLKERTYAGKTTFFPGAFSIGEVDMLDVRPLGATVVLALAAWNTDDPSWGAMLAHAGQATRAGIVAFVQPTTDPTVGGSLPKDLAMDRDLVLSEIPEPSGLALAGLGGVLLLLSRRRGQRTSNWSQGSPTHP